MNQQRSTAPMSDDQVWETVIMTIVGLAGLGWLVGNLPKVAEWLVAHRILVSGYPMLTLPSTGGAGLDGPRIAIAAAVVAALILWLVTWMARAVRHAKDREAGA